jgi:hypothetical protein
VKGSFGVNNNQLLGFEAAIWCASDSRWKNHCLRHNSKLWGFVCTSGSVFENIWSKHCSLQSQYINQLEWVIENCGWSN